MAFTFDRGGVLKETEERSPQPNLPTPLSIAIVNMYAVRCQGVAYWDDTDDNLGGAGPRNSSVDLEAAAVDGTLHVGYGIPGSTTTEEGHRRGGKFRASLFSGLEPLAQVATAVSTLPYIWCPVARERAQTRTRTNVQADFFSPTGRVHTPSDAPTEIPVRELFPKCTIFVGCAL